MKLEVTAGSFVVINTRAEEAGGRISGSVNGGHRHRQR